MESVIKSWLPRRKIVASSIGGALMVLLIAFAPRFGIEFTNAEKDALKSAGATLVVTVLTGYIVPGEKLAKDQESTNEGTY